MSGRMRFTCDGVERDVDAAPGETLLSVLRERLGVTSPKDGCAPQGQCGCCTVLVDGEPRVACVTPAARVEGREVTTAAGLPAAERDALVEGFLATGGSQCGFCTPGIVVRAAAALRRGRTSDAELDRALAAHLCRCTGWLTVREAVRRAAGAPGGPAAPVAARAPGAAERRAELEGGARQRVCAAVPLGDAGFADDTAPRDALVAVPAPAGLDGSVETLEAAGRRWVVRPTLGEARSAAGKVQGRRTTVAEQPPLPAAGPVPGGVHLATCWVEPAYLEPDASWCVPGGDPASPLANGGAFGGKVASPAPPAARALADRLGRPVRVLLSREDVVRVGPKRPPVSASAVLRGGAVEVRGTLVWRDGAVPPAFADPFAGGRPYTVGVRASWQAVDVPGPPVSGALRAAGLAEHAVLLEGALDAAGADREALVADARAAGALLDTVVAAPGGGLAGARVDVDAATGELARVVVRVAAGDPLDEVVLRSYAVGAVHAALGWVLSEGLAVDPADGEVQDLTIRSFGVIRARDTPPVDVHVLDDPGPPRPVADAVFAAVAAAAWNAVTRADGTRPATFPARGARAARRLRR